MMSPPMMPPPMMSPPMMPPPMMPQTSGERIQSITNTMKSQSSPDIMIYIFALLFIIAVALAGAVSSGSATFTSIPFTSIKGNLKDNLNVIGNKNLLINTTGSVDEKDYTINVSQANTTQSLLQSIPTLEFNSNRTPVVNFNRYNSTDVVPTKKLKSLKEFDNPALTTVFNGYANKNLYSKTQPPSENSMAFIASVANGGNIGGNSVLAFATVTPVSDGSPQTNLSINSGNGGTYPGGLRGQFVRSISTGALTNPESFTSYGYEVLDISKNQDLKYNTSYMIQGENVNLQGDVTLTLPGTEGARIGDFINIFWSRHTPASKFSKLFITCPQGSGENPFLGIGSTLLQKSLTTGDINYQPRLQVCKGNNKGMYVTTYRNKSELSLSNVVLKFVCVNGYTGFRTFTDPMKSFRNTWICECSTSNPLILLGFQGQQ